MSLTICGETGKALTETVDDVTFPADYSFATVNDYVHSTGTNFEDLQSLCLGMATHIEKYERRIAPPEREPLSDDDIDREHDKNGLDYSHAGLQSFRQGVRFAEWKHGIAKLAKSKQS